MTVTFNWQDAMIEVDNTVLQTMGKPKYVLLLQYLKSGKYTFASRDVFETLGKSSNTVTAFLKKLCDEKILEETKGKPGAIMEYCFSSGDVPFTETDYSEEVITLLSYLSKNHRSPRDARIGTALL